jgi:hypothetical protein
MLIELQTPENTVVFHMDIADMDTDGYNVYCAAHAIWGEQGWHTLTVSHKGVVIDQMINSSTMIPTIASDK